MGLWIAFYERHTYATIAFMNILILSWRSIGHPNAGGAEIVTMEHAKGWVNAGHKVTLFTSSFENCNDEEVIDGVQIIRRGGQAFGVKIEAFFWYIFGKHDAFDLVVDEFHGIPFFTPLYVRKTKLAFIHEVAKEVWKLNPWPEPFNLIPDLIGSWFEPLIFKWVYRRVMFMTVSKSTSTDLKKWGIKPSLIQVIYNGVELPGNLPRLPKYDPCIVGYLGALSKDKGVEDALMVFSELHQKFPEWQFWMIGHGDERILSRLKQLSNDLNISKAIKYWGFVSEAQKFRLLAQSSVMINPSVREGWGLVVIEAAAVGTPTVGYDVPGLRDSIIDGKTGFLSQKNVRSMVEKVEEILINQKRYQLISKNAVKWAANFKWSKSQHESLKLIEHLVDRK